ncbi:CRISPR-associated protein Cas1 [Desulfovibrio sp. DV]|nr:CRISPR-associated protein Cas1 [Desulfovibrio sp. DV]
MLVSGHGVTYSNDLLAALAERAVPVVLCGSNMQPLSVLWPLSSHHLSGQRIKAQAEAGLPLRKRLWQSLVQVKILLQASNAELHEAKGGHLRALAKSVKSGDPDNVEAEAARLYFKTCFGPDFRRDRDAPGINAQLNYGYTVLRAATARAVMLAGLHPAFGLHHCNARNSMPLVDDLMEPFRPVVDMLALRLQRSEIESVDKKAKCLLSALPNVDMPLRKKTGTVSSCLAALASSLADVLMGERRQLLLPSALIPLGDTPPPPWPS